MADPIATIGDNHPPLPILDLAKTLDPDVLRASIEADYIVEQQRTDNLMAGLSRFQAAMLESKGLQNAAMQGKAADFIRQLREAAKDIEAKRDAYKRPVINAGKTIDAVFKGSMIDKLVAARDIVMGEINAYDARMRKAEADRLRAEAEAQAAERRRLAQAETDRLAAEAAEFAARGDNEVAMEIEAEIEQVKQDARKIVAEPIAPVDQVRAPVAKSDLGSTVSGRVTWHWELQDISKVPPAFLATNDVMINAMMKSDPQIKTGAQPIPGIRFFSRNSTVVR